MSELLSLAVDDSLWERVYQVSPLVVVGTREPDGSYDLAPKHRVVVLSPRLFGFVCRESHATYRNARREGAFTVSWPGPRQIVMTSAAASPRCEDGEKSVMKGLPTTPAKQVDGVLLAGCPLYTECELERVIDDLDERDGLVIGRVVAAWADPRAVRSGGWRDGALVHDHPLLAYLHPNRFATIGESYSFPFPKGFSRE